MEERRHHPRFNVRYFAAIGYRDENIYASVTNISKEGIGIVLTRKLPVKEVVELRISSQVSDRQRAEIKMKAKVIWLEGLGGERIFRAGLKILEVSKEDIEGFKKVMQSLRDKSADEREKE